MADDPSVPDHSRLLRRVPADVHHILWDKTTRAYRLSSQVFKNLQDDPPAFSVSLECRLQELQLSPEAVIIDRGRYGLIALPAALVRQHRQSIERHPEPDDPSHGHVVGQKPKPVAKAFGRAVTENGAIVWVIPPPGWPWGPPVES